jgi:hypothetical protein
VVWRCPRFSTAHARRRRRREMLMPQHEMISVPATTKGCASDAKTLPPPALRPAVQFHQHHHELSRPASVSPWRTRP